MSEEPNNSQFNEIEIVGTINDLHFLKQFVEHSNSVSLYGEFEIEPFTVFSIEFQAAYWYLKYLVLKNQVVRLDYDTYAFYDENNLNVIWLSVKNEHNSIIECRDGNWSVRLSRTDDGNRKLFSRHDVSL
ncbi:hypothetical protein ACXZ1K_11420 [Pedobacter sp. PWIIR3]